LSLGKGKVVPVLN